MRRGDSSGEGALLPAKPFSRAWRAGRIAAPTGSMAIVAPMAGAVTFSGNAAPHSVLYKSSTVTIALDEQTLRLPQAATGGIVGPTITTDAIDIHLNHATFAGQTITGKLRHRPKLGELCADAPHGLA